MAFRKFSIYHLSIFGYNRFMVIIDDGVFVALLIGGFLEMGLHEAYLVEGADKSLLVPIERYFGTLQ